MSQGLPPRAGRRGFLKLAASSLLMAGCSRLNDSETAQSVLSFFDRWNHQAGLMLDSPYRLARTYPREAVQPEQMRPNGSVVTPGSQLVQTPEEEWTLTVGEVRLANGKMAQTHWREEYTLDQLRRLPALEQTVEHVCVEGWSAICHWKGLALADLLRRRPLRPESRYVFFLCDDLMRSPRGMERYSVTLDLHQALHPQNVLAYEYNGEKLTPAHGAPLRLASPVNVGWKSAKYVRYIFVMNEDLGGFWEAQGYPRYYGF
ncbi:MAG: molybdopterin-dependent oxidoreductase [Candidatus Tectomicrobia bacterium]|uniref:Molybdopterin-dependent oxidoreductase n=1 Tax=Tectimicrobiota bacterium TaxID=2528274 RepID=A0A932I1R8_UNCTE|nr:molybdopterin-dependent oxidoreductase [Candidatus Tectomicrobia bacterium]